VAFDTGTILAGSPVTFDLDVSNTGRLRATGLEVRIERPRANQFAAFPLAENPSGVTTGDRAMGYSWASAGDPADADGQVRLSEVLRPGETVGLSFTLILSDNFAPGGELRVVALLARGGCGD